jgi:large subunit ribosomal protein L5
MNLQEKYYQELKSQIQKELGIENVMAVPRLVKIVVSVSTKEALTDKKVLDIVAEQLGQITGQKPVIKNAKKSVAAFKLREGQPIGVMVTLRSRKMYEFLEKMIRIVFPRVRDFRGVSLNSFDGKGNYSLGFREQIVFPEIEYSKIDKIRGLEVTIVTSGRSDEKGRALLKALGMPFEKK